MKISIVTPDLSHNCLGRAYLLAKVLQRDYEVEIIGPIFGDGIWQPLAGLDDVPFQQVKIEGRFKAYWQLKELLKKIDGDVIYASKPLFTSFGIALLNKMISKKPLVLDIDDWQLGFVKESYKKLSFIQRSKALAYSMLLPYRIGSYWNNLFSEKLIRFADEITVANSFLQKKFGGTIVWHARDTQALAPKKFNKCSLREEYNIGRNKKVVMFFGTPRLHKGIEDLIEGISLLRDRDVMLALVGLDGQSYSRSLAKLAGERLGERFKGFGLQPFERVPEFLAMSDVIVIPQRRSFSSLGQVPAKVFDAMAMAKPIVATSASGLPEILDRCGWITEPENPEQLVQAIQYILDNPDKAEEMGKKARKKCIEKYSWNAMEEVLIDIFDKYG